MNHDQLTKAVLVAVENAQAKRPYAIPEPAKAAWNMFIDLANRRTYTAAGAQPIQYSEIEAYARLMQIPLAPHHIAQICAIDNKILEMQRKAAGKSSHHKPMTGVAWDQALGGMQAAG